MSDRTCPTCGQPVSGTATICHACATELAGWLHTLPDLYAQLRQGTARATSEGHAQAAEPPAPLAAGCLDHRETIRTVVADWADWATEHLGVPDPGTLQARCHALADRARLIARHDQAPTIHHEIRTLHTHAARLIDRPHPRPTIGECASTVEDGKPCPGHLTLDGNTLRCSWCGVEWVHDQWPQLAELVGAPNIDRAIDINTTATLLGVSRNRASEIVTAAGIPHITQPDSTHAKHYPYTHIARLAAERAK